MFDNIIRFFKEIFLSKKHSEIPCYCLSRLSALSIDYQSLVRERKNLEKVEEIFEN